MKYQHLLRNKRQLAASVLCKLNMFRRWRRNEAAGAGARVRRKRHQKTLAWRMKKNEAEGGLYAVSNIGGDMAAMKGGIGEAMAEKRGGNRAWRRRRSILPAEVKKSRQPPEGVKLPYSKRTDISTAKAVKYRAL